MEVPMKTGISFLFLAALFLIAGQNLFAQDNALAQKAFVDYMTPGKMQNMLAKNAGRWQTKFKLWTAPGANPIVAEGNMIAETLLDGRYLQSKHSANVNGMPMMGIGLDAYDNGRKIFVSTWIDNLSTGIMTLEGSFDEGTRTFTYTGKSYDPAAGKEVPVKEILRYIDDDHQIMEMFMIQGNNEIKTMEVEMTRIK